MCVRENGGGGGGRMCVFEREVGMCVCDCEVEYV